MNNLIRRFLPMFPIVLIILFFLSFTSILLWDPDFFWHLKTGEYIVAHKEIPNEDPFSYTTAPGETLRKDFILRQYWLAQLVFYAIWKQVGIGGIVVLRALILSAALLIIYLIARKKADPLLLVIFLFLSGMIFRDFTGDRPQLFSFLFVALLIFVVERYKESRGSILYFLPIVTIIWANLHGGVILGDAILVVYIFSESIRYMIKRPLPEKKDYVRFLLISGVAIIASAANPNTYRLFAAFYQFSDSISQQMTTEFLSPITIALRYNKIYYLYFLMLFVISVILLLRVGKMDLGRAAVLIFLCAVSLESARYMIFPAIMFPVLAVDASDIIRDKFSRIRLLAAAGIIVFSCYSVSKSGVFAFTIRESYPDKAVEFIRNTKPSGNLFNYFDWGGYLIATLPEYKVFIDGRGLDETVRLKYTMVITGSTLRYSSKYEWEHILDNYGVNVILLPWRHIDMPGSPRIVEILMSSPEWKLSYSDKESVVFLRSNPLPQKT